VNKRLTPDFGGRSPAYKALARLVDVGGVEEVDVRQGPGRGAPQVVFAVTDAGRTRCETWMRSELPDLDAAAELTTRMRFARREDLPVLLELVDAEIGRLSARQAELRAEQQQRRRQRPPVTHAGPPSPAEVAELLDEQRIDDLLVQQVKWLTRAAGDIERLIDDGGAG
jgi:DNA-binding PadR family transcriptional regulator